MILPGGGITQPRTSLSGCICTTPLSHLFGKELPEAGPPADAEGDDPLVLDELSGQLIDEAVGPELSRLLPVRGVVHHVVEVGEHLRGGTKCFVIARHLESPRIARLTHTQVQVPQPKKRITVCMYLFDKRIRTDSNLRFQV